MDTAAHWFSDLISADLALLQRSTGPGPFWPSSVLRHTAGPGARPAFGKRLVERVHGVLTARGEDPKQALRLRRYFLAAGTSLLALGIFFACYLQRLLPSDAFLQIASAIALAIVIFYLLFSTGINRKSTDPSLTIPQMMVATTVVLYAMYRSSGGRGIFLVLLLMVFVFGVLQLRTRALLGYGLFVVVAYGTVLLFLWGSKPQSLDLSLELLQWFVLAVTVPWFSMMGGYLSRLRERLRQSRAEHECALQRVRASETSLAEAQHIAQLGSWTLNETDTVGKWSPGTYRIFGLDPTLPVPVGESFMQLVHPEDRLRYGEIVHPALRDGRSFDIQHRIVLPSGDIRWIHARGHPAVDHQRQTALLRGTVADITERKQFEQRQAMEHAVTRLLAGSDTVSGAMPTIIQTICETLGWDHGARWCQDESDGLLRCAETWSVDSSDVRAFVALSSQHRLVPRSAGLIRRVWTTGEPVWIADLSRQTDFLRAAIASRAGLRAAFAFPISKGGEISSVLEFYTRDAHQPDPALLRVTRSIGMQIGQFIARKAAEEQIRQLAHFDFLTGLPNRNLFNRLLEHALAKAQRHEKSLALLFIDLDGFKQINDSLGHDAGDCLLTNFAQRLRDCLRASDPVGRRGEPNTAARLGGDEFVVLIEDFFGPSDLSIVAERILAMAAKPFDLAGAEGRVTASIGISIYPSDGGDIDILLKRADSAMYDAKEAGKNNYRFFTTPVLQSGDLPIAPRSRDSLIFASGNAGARLGHA